MKEKEKLTDEETMKIVSWNCHYGFDGDKPAIIKKFGADILVIPECREKDMEASGYDTTHRDWYGDHKEAKDNSGNINKEKDLGIGIFWKEGITVTQLSEWENTLSKNSDFRYLIPYRVERNSESFVLIAVWTKGIIKTDPNDKLAYVQKAHAAIDHYKSIGLLNDKVVLIGDFNSDTIWDECYREDQNHSALVKKLGREGIIDCSRIDGENSHPTYHYYTKGGEKQAVDDHCFVSKKLAESPKFSVPGPEEWTQNENGVKHWNGSDHCPISVECDF
jgi:endonuclease/exonuclease/phosphatase family metal-dependent hydrolase